MRQHSGGSKTGAALSRGEQQDAQVWHSLTHCASADSCQMKGPSICSRSHGVDWYLVTPWQRARTLKAALLLGTATNSGRLVEVAKVYMKSVIEAL